MKRAHRRSTFSGFFGPPFLLSFTMNFSLQEKHVGSLSASGPASTAEARLLTPRHAGGYLICLASRVSYREKKTSASSLMLL